MNKNYSILAIDDDSEILFALGAVFEYKGWKYYSAEDAANGLKLFKDKAPDIVLMDYHLPGINGIEGVRKLRRLSKDVPIIVFTVETDQKVADEFLNAGATDFAMKPIKAPDIISRVSLHIELMESKRRNIYQDDFVAKGISMTTLKLFEEALSRCKDFVTVEHISRNTGFAEQTAYRYLQHMVTSGTIEVNYKYGKVGRPKKLFKLKDINNKP